METELRELLTDTLRLGSRGEALTAQSELLGSIPELDSMAIVSVLTQIEEDFDIEFDDDEISAESFATLASLCSLVEGKVEST